MKRYILIVLCSVVLMAIQFFINCSNPLESLDEGDLTPYGYDSETDTIYILDTTTVFDTTTIVDTTTFTDTIMIVDTITIIDTVVVIEPDSTGTSMACSRIVSTLKDIVWMFRNDEGDYLLEFSAFTEHDKPKPSLLVNIDGQEFIWNLVENTEFITELHLSENTMIRIRPNKPPSLGHAIDVCLTMSVIEP